MIAQQKYFLIRNLESVYKPTKCTPNRTYENTARTFNRTINNDQTELYR